MGTMIRLSCGHCGYELEAPIGVGLASFRPSVIGELLKGKEREEWKKLSDDQEFLKCFGEQKIAYCTECKELFSIFSVTGQKKDGTEYTWGNKCPKCSSQLELIQDINEITCPSCKSAVLDVRQTGLWD